MKYKKEIIALCIVFASFLLGILLAFMLWYEHAVPKRRHISEAKVVEKGYVYAIENIEQAGDYYSITGFCQKENAVIQFIDIQCVLYDNESGNIYVLPTKWQIRGDVTTEMIENGEEYDKSGFVSQFYVGWLDDNKEYQIGIWYKNDGNNALVLSDEMLDI